MIGRIRWLLETQFGLDPNRLFRGLIFLPRYFGDWRIFRRGYSGKMVPLPCLHDRDAPGGTARGEYFWQDLYVAREIYRASPSRHLDIGSRVDGFVAHVASFRNIEVIDIRRIEDTVPGVTFRQADLMDSSAVPDGSSPSLSCLHALEHFGLGRYGDSINPMGHRDGLRNLARIVANGGVLYLSVPVGKARVEFNAHRVICPNWLVRQASEFGLKLRKFAWVSPGGVLTEDDPLAPLLDWLAGEDYNLGIFVFEKNSVS
jgi:SAM-dependent methyltransferase